MSFTKILSKRNIMVAAIVILLVSLNNMAWMYKYTADKETHLLVNTTHLSAIHNEVEADVTTLITSVCDVNLSDFNINCNCPQAERIYKENVKVIEVCCPGGKCC